MVAAVEDITLIDDETPGALPQVGSNGTILCLEALSGGAPVAGATWTFTTSANINLSALPFGPACMFVTGLTDGPATLSATASGLGKTFALTVDLSKDRHAGHHASQSRPLARQ